MLLTLSKSKPFIYRLLLWIQNNNSQGGASAASTCLFLTDTEHDIDITTTHRQYDSRLIRNNYCIGTIITVLIV